MTRDKDMSEQAVRALAQESLAGVERMKPLEAELKSLQGIENLKPQYPQASPDKNPPQPQANTEDNQVPTDTHDPHK